MLRSIRAAAAAAAVFAVLTGGAALAQDRMSGSHMQDKMHTGAMGDKMHAGKMSPQMPTAQAAMTHAMARMSAADRRTVHRAMAKLTPHERYVMMKAVMMSGHHATAMRAHSKMAHPAKMSHPGDKMAHPGGM